MAETKKLTLNVTIPMHEFIDGQSDKLGVTTTEYIRRLIGLGSIVEMVRHDIPEQEGRFLYIASRPEQGEGQTGELVQRAMISDILI